MSGEQVVRTTGLMLAVFAAGLIVAGCRSSDVPSPFLPQNPGPGDGERSRITGVAQKGPFQQYMVQGFAVGPQGQPVGDPIVGVNMGQGGFQIDVPLNVPVVIQVTGSFTNEITGQAVSLDDPLTAVVIASEPEQIQNVNVATHLAGQDALGAAAQGTTLTLEQLAASTDRMQRLLGFVEGTDINRLDLENIPGGAGLDDPNLHLQLLSGGVMSLPSRDGKMPESFGAISDRLREGNVSEDDLRDSFAVLNGLGAIELIREMREREVANLPIDLLLPPEEVVWLCDDGCGFIGAPGISVAGMTVYEGLGAMDFIVRRSGDATGAASVKLRTRSTDPVSAEPTFDYLPQDALIEFAANQREARLRIPLVIDTLTEGRERFEVTIAEPTGGTLRTATAPVTLLDGLPPGLSEVTADIAVAQFCRLGLGDGRLNVGGSCSTTADGSLPLLDGVPNLLRVALTLSTSCAGQANCAAEGRDWAVGFDLVAREGQSERGRLDMGAYAYPAESLVASNAGGLPLAPQVILRFADEPQQALIEQARGSGWSLQVEARVRAQPSAVATLPLPSPVLLPPTALFGDRSLPLIPGVFTLAPDASCGADAQRLDARFAFIEAEFGGDQLGDLFAGEVDLTQFDGMPLSSACVRIANGMLVVTQADIAPPSPSIWRLPVGQGTRLSLGELAFTQEGALLDFGGAAGIQTELFSEGLPLAFKVTGLRLTENGLVVQMSGARSLTATVGFSPTDMRSGAALSANDILFRGGATAGSLGLTREGGLNGTVRIAADSGSLAYPQAQLSWPAFDLQIEDGGIAATTPLLNLTYTLTQSVDCDAPGCAAGAPRQYRATGNLQLAPGGHALTSALNLQAISGGIATAGFGARADRSLNFERPQDLTAGTPVTVAFTGFAYGAGDPVAAQLPGHLQGTAEGVTVHAAGSPAYRNGNYAPTGLSVGPELYVGASAQPVVGSGRSLQGLSQRIAGPQGLSLASQLATKYVLRRSGFTGVYNADPASLSGAVDLSGFPLQLSRFAFRVVDNALDPETWIDGRFSIPGLAGLDDIVFAGLQIDCAARLGQGRLVAEACNGQDDNNNGVIDDNCPTVLSAWAFPTTVQSLRFERADPSPAQSCTAESQLAVLGQSVRPLALDKPLSMELGWTPQGTLARQSARDLRQYQLDGAPEQRGFGVRLASATLVDAPDATQGGASRGWLSGRSQVALPFWSALEADVRLENRLSLGEATAAASLLVPPGTLAGLPAGQPNSALAARAVDDTQLHFDVDYRWGNTSFGFSLPAYYRPLALAPNEPPQFIGRRREVDLFVLEAGVGINFIEPERTKFSFGASADIARLRSLEFQVNLEDAASLDKVDSLLVRTRLTRGPVLAPAYDGLQSRLNVLNRFANEGIDRLTEAALLKGLEEAGATAAGISPLGEDPIISLSKGLSLLHSLPSQVIGVIESEVRSPVLAVLNDVEQQVRGPLLEARSELENLGNNAAVPAPVVAKLRQARAALVRAAAEAGRLESTVTRRIDDVGQLVAALDAPVARTQTALNEVEQLLRRITAINAAICNTASSLPGEAAGFVGPLFSHLQNTQALLTLVGGSELLLPIVELVVDDAAVRDSLRSGQQQITQAADDLLLKLRDAEAVLKGNLCGSDIDTLLAQANALLAQGRSALTTVQGAQQAVNQDLEEIKALTVLYGITLVAPLNQIIAELEPVIALLDANPPPLAGAYRTALDDAQAAALAALKNGQPGLFDNVVVLLSSDPAVQQDVIRLMFDGLRQGLNLAVDRAALTLTTAAAALPSVNHTPDELRGLLVGLIMDSAPVKELRTAVNAQLVEVHRQINTLVLQVTDQLNSAIKGALARVEGEINSVLSQATAPLKSLPMDGAKLDGYAVIAAQELERVHVAAEWTLPGGGEGDDAKTFGAAFEAVSWNASNKTAGCSIPEGSSRIDAKISAFNLPARFGVSELMVKVVELGFTLEQTGGALRPKGVFGGIDTQGEIGFTEFIIYDPALKAGVGDLEVYVGARAGAVFSDIAAEVAFLAGKTCNQDILASLDPVAGQFIPLPPSGFFGAYVRGSATIPIIPGSCALTVSAVADVGAWVLAGPPAALGGLVGGGAIGRVGCMAALRGQIRALAQVDTTGRVLFVGEGFGVAGVGLCEPATWTTVPRSRQDSFCVTADALFRARYLDGWSVLDLSVGGLF